MYQTLIFYHSIMRWFVLASLIFAVYKAAKGYFTKSNFTKLDDAVRSWTATIAHIQLMIGMTLYFQSPVVKYFMANFKNEIADPEFRFFSVIHSSLMIIAIVLITIGSAKAKRDHDDQTKFKTMLLWFSIALAVILVAIPWPFSPFANRPYLR